MAEDAVDADLPMDVVPDTVEGEHVHVAEEDDLEHVGEDGEEDEGRRRTAKAGGGLELLGASFVGGR